MQWHIITGDQKDAIFDVALDKPGSDSTVFMGLADCAVTKLIQNSKMYIGNPKNATDNFQIVT